MSRITAVSPQQANEQQAALFDAVKSKLGRVPNMLQTLAQSPAALQSYLDFSAAVGSGTALNAKQREIVSLAVGQANGCEYCLAAHTTIGKMVGLTAEEVEAARRGDGINDTDRAVARFATEVLSSRGRVEDQDLADFRAAGFGDDAVAEVVANVALNVFTNYFNNVAEPKVDFPAAPELPEATLESTGATCSSGVCSV